MSSTSVLPDHSPERLARQKARLQALLDQARERYAGGAPGLQVASLISAKTDRLIVELFEEVLSQLDPAEVPEITANVALIAVGGSGRGELAPYSDADILFLHRGRASTRLVGSISQTVRDCWDAGISPAASTRTLGDALKMARDDPQFATALIEARLLWGDARLFESLRAKFYRQIVRRRFASFYNACLAAREEERQQHGSTVRQLEPDVKRSPGGLRDIHLIRWLGYARYGTTDLDLLRLEGAISREDVQTLVAAQEFLTRIRVELHFASGKAQELLTRAEQLRLAELYGFTASAGQRPVERFMQIYFRHSTAIADIAARFAALHRPRSLRERVWRYLVTHRNGIFHVGPDEIDVVAGKQSEVCNDLAGLLHLYELAGQYSINPAPALTEMVKQAVPLLGAQLVARPGYKLTEQEAKLFLSILGSRNAGQQLRNMYATRVLELVIPQVSHVRCLLQFNQYHAYTVDEHSLRAVEAAVKFDADRGALGTAYREIRPKEILHLALLLHDLGKGYEEDHSVLGRDLAKEVAARLYLSDHESELLSFLVHKHLRMPHLAFRRDITDPNVVLEFSREVGSPERLRMLFVLSAADISAVSPEAWTGWKAELLTELYERSLRALGGEHENIREAERLEKLRQKVRASLQSTGPSTTGEGQSLLPYEEQLATFPMHYLDATPPEEIVADLQSMRDIDQQAVVVRAKYEPDSHTVEYRVITRDQIGFGCFSKITGALTAKRLEILSANICTTSRGIVIDSFRVHDGDHDGEIPDFRQEEVIGAIRDVLSGKRSVESLFQRHRRFVTRVPLTVTDEPIRVAIDNTSSLRFTIIDVFANDRPGLLYAIASGLLEMDLSVSLAKIATHVDQVLDVFYVTDREGKKIQDEARIRSIQTGLASRLAAFEQQGLTSVPA